MYTDSYTKILIVKGLQQATKAMSKTYTTEKIQIVGCCDLFVLHPGTKDLQEVTFQMTNHEGSVIHSYTPSLQLGLIQPHEDLDVVPDSGSLIYSKVDLTAKQKDRKSMPISKLRKNMKTREMLSSPVTRVPKTEVSQSVNHEFKANYKLQQCLATVNTMFDDKCQETKEIHMLSVKPNQESNHKWSSLRPQSLYKKEKVNWKHVSTKDDKQCQSHKNMKYITLH